MQAEKAFPLNTDKDSVKKEITVYEEIHHPQDEY